MDVGIPQIFVINVHVMEGMIHYKMSQRRVISIATDWNAAVFSVGVVLVDLKWWRVFTTDRKST